MAKAKLARSRLRSPRRVKGSNPRSRTPQNIPPELRAPITGEVERQLKHLVAQFGEKQVLDALGPLITKCKWNDWQCVANVIRRIARNK